LQVLRWLQVLGLDTASYTAALNEFKGRMHSMPDDGDAEKLPQESKLRWELLPEGRFVSAAVGSGSSGSAGEEALPASSGFFNPHVDPTFQEGSSSNRTKVSTERPLPRVV